ncbi:p33K [bottlenose dolphin adenovirus 2]|uniref:P33K n=1 Tax=bottlenose dolphin adenovirus 2 TaxID=2849592 RepID=A0A0M4LSU5_9ADEN|nr:p33K [Bottlenose dolphin adenovirus 1]ALE15309.1 p33K [Bottlenose dolphin adenovirus 1]
MRTSTTEPKPARPTSLNLTNPKMKKHLMKPKEEGPLPVESDQEEEGEWYEDISDSSEEEGTTEEEVTAPPPLKKAKKETRWDIAPNADRQSQKNSEQTESASTEALRAKIFPILYAVFQKSRGRRQKHKIRNRSLRSLTKSCLYHNSETQLQRTLEDADSLLNKYCD